MGTEARKGSRMLLAIAPACLAGVLIALCLFPSVRTSAAADAIKREWIYFWYYFTLQFSQIAGYWALGMVLGSAVSVLAKKRIHGLAEALGRHRPQKGFGIVGIAVASVLGIASPLCMYGTVPLAASLSRKGMRDDWLAAFMMSSILLNPQLAIYSAALGPVALAIRLACSVACGVIAGLLVKAFFKGSGFFDFSGFGDPEDHDTDPNLAFRLIRNLGRNVKATAGYFIIGIVLSALFSRYVPARAMEPFFGSGSPWAALAAATLGVPLYMCGGGTVPLLKEWLSNGMGMGSAAAFMVTGPATKITNLGAVKIVLGARRFAAYIAYCFACSLVFAMIIDAFM